jgi:streptomycin 3"-adenylyltransferase
LNFVGSVPLPTFDRDLAILLKQVTHKSLCLSGRPAAELFDKVPEKDFAQALLAATAQWKDAFDWQGDERNVILALARIWFSARTGQIISKDAAATWALRHLPAQYRQVVAAAQEAYRGSVEDDLSNRTDEVAAFVQYAKALIESS